jgi:hypothetical protein
LPRLRRRRPLASKPQAEAASSAALKVMLGRALSWRGAQKADTGDSLQSAGAWQSVAKLTDRFRCTQDVQRSASYFRYRLKPDVLHRRVTDRTRPEAEVDASRKRTLNAQVIGGNAKH